MANALNDLSPRQFEAAKLSAQGLTTREIAEVMGVSPSTAKQYITEARRKLGLGRKRDLIKVVNEMEAA